VKLFYIGPMFARTPEKGPLPGIFIRLGADVLGGTMRTIDAEVVEMVMTFSRSWSCRCPAQCEFDWLPRVPAKIS